MCHFEDEHRQVHAIFTTTLSLDIFVGCVNQFHYHTFNIEQICMTFVTVRRTRWVPPSFLLATSHNKQHIFTLFSLPEERHSAVPTLPSTSDAATICTRGATRSRVCSGRPSRSGKSWTSSSWRPFSSPPTRRRPSSSSCRITWYHPIQLFWLVADDGGK